MTARRIDPADRDPHPLSHGLDQVAERLGLARSRDLSTIFSSWPDVVGETVAAHSKPTALRGTNLQLVVDHPGWATQLRHLEGDLVERLSTAVGPGVVESITIRVDST